MTNKFFLIRVSLPEGTRTRTDMSDHDAAEKIAEFAAMLFCANTDGPLKPMTAGHVIDRDLSLKGALQR